MATIAGGPLLSDKGHQDKGYGGKHGDSKGKSWKGSWHPNPVWRRQAAYSGQRGPPFPADGGGNQCPGGRRPLRSFRCHRRPALHLICLALARNVECYIEDVAASLAADNATAATEAFAVQGRGAALSLSRLGVRIRALVETDEWAMKASTTIPRPAIRSGRHRE